MKQLTAEEVKQIPGMRNNGMTNDEIAEHFGVSTGSISQWVRKLREAGYEVKRFPRGGRKPIKL